MKIKILPTIKNIDSSDYNGLNDDFIIVVIDVLRATSTIVTALYLGASSVIPVTSVKEAKKVQKNLHIENSLLCGEENIQKIEGFDLGNSPLEYEKEFIKNKIIIFKTSNGTKVLRKCYDLFSDKKMYIASFLASIGVSIARIKTDSLRKICDGFVQVALSRACNSSTVIGFCVLGIEADSIGQVGDRTVQVVCLVADHASIMVCESIL